MKIRFYQTCSTVLISLLFISPVSSQDTPEHVYLTMDEAIQRSLGYNNQVRASKYGLKKATWEKRYAWTQLFPRVTFNTRYTWIDDSTFALRDFSRYFQDDDSPFGIQIPQTVFQKSYYTSIDVTMTLFDGKLLNGLFIASSSEDAASHIDESTRRNIIFIAVKSYLDVLKNEEILHLQKEYLKLSRLNYEKAERLHQAGRYSKAEVLRWKVDLQQQKSILVSSESNDRSTRSTLLRVLNFDMLTTIEIDSTIPNSIANEASRLSKLPEEQILAMIKIDDQNLIEANAALSAALENKHISKLLYRNSFTSYMPNVALSYSYAWRENSTLKLDDYSPQTLTINFSIPLFTSFQNLTDVKSQYYAYKQSQENFQDQLQNTRLLLTQTVNKLLNLRTQKELSAVNVEYTERNYRIVEQQKEQGLVSNIDFIDAKLNLQNAKIQDISNHYDFITSMIELYYLVGNLNSIIEY